MKEFTSMKTRATQILKDCVIMITTVIAVTGIAAWLKCSNPCTHPGKYMYVVATVLVALFTKGYAYGFITAISSVLLTNFLFMNPLYEFNFRMSQANLINLATLLISSCVLSFLVSRLRIDSNNKIRSERERMHANLLRSISHDLRSPLTSIAGSARTIRENGNVLTEEQKDELLKNVINDSEELITMVENLLMITRVSGDVRLEKQMEAAEEIVGSAVFTFKNKYPDVTVRTYYPEEILLIPMNATLIVQVLRNLLENSVQHGGGVDLIEITVTKERKEAHFCVIDNGKGYHPHENKIPDEQGHNMGIGLSLCRSIVEAHGGKCKAGNSQKGGAKMFFTLPLR